MKLTISTLAGQLRSFSEYLQRVGADLFREAFRVHGISSLTLLQLRYLEMIEARPGMTPGDLAESFQVRKPTVSNILRQLEQQALITREKGGNDGRVCRLFATDRTRAVFAKRRGMYSLLARRIGKKLTQSEMKALMLLFTKILSEEVTPDER
jgi:MarR family transcriptional regulator for hemolysin